MSISFSWRTRITRADWLTPRRLTSDVPRAAVERQDPRPPRWNPWRRMWQAAPRKRPSPCLWGDHWSRPKTKVEKNSFSIWLRLELWQDKHTERILHCRAICQIAPLVVRGKRHTFSDLPFDKKNLYPNVLQSKTKRMTAGTRRPHRPLFREGGDPRDAPPGSCTSTWMLVTFFSNQFFCFCFYFDAKWLTLFFSLQLDYRKSIRRSKTPRHVVNLKSQKQITPR